MVRVVGLVERIRGFGTIVVVEMIGIVGIAGIVETEKGSRFTSLDHHTNSK